MKYLLNAVCILALIMPAFAETFSGKNFSIDYKSWFKTSYPTFDAMFLCPKNSTGTFHENISILTRKHPSKSKTINWNAIKKWQIATLKKTVGNFKLISWKDTTLDLARGKKIHYSGTYANLKLQWIQIYVIKDSTWYVVSYVGDHGKDFKDYYKEANAIINSFKFK